MRTFILCSSLAISDPGRRGAAARTGSSAGDRSRAARSTRWTMRFCSGRCRPAARRTPTSTASICTRTSSIRRRSRDATAIRGIRSSGAASPGPPRTRNRQTGWPVTSSASGCPTCASSRSICRRSGCRSRGRSRPSSGATTLQLDRSAAPAYGTPGTGPDGLDVDAVWVGTGSDADFAGRDVRGKAVFMFSMALPGLDEQHVDAGRRTEARGNTRRGRGVRGHRAAGQQSQHPVSGAGQRSGLRARHGGRLRDARPDRPVRAGTARADPSGRETGAEPEIIAGVGHAARARPTRRSM